MSEIDQILSWDEKNSRKALEGICAIDPGCIPFTDSLAIYLSNLAKKFGEKCEYVQNVQIASKWMRDLGIGSDAGFEIARKAVLLGESEDEFSSAEGKEALIRASAITARIFLSLRLKKDYLNGVTSLLRANVISMLGCLRLQSENVAIITLLEKDIKASDDWFATTDVEAGRIFHNKYQKRIRKIIDDLGLAEHYNFGSNVSYHIRASGSGMGIITGQKASLGSDVVLRHQDINSVELIYLFLTHFLEMHIDLISKSEHIFPELSTDDFVSLGREKIIEGFQDRLTCRTKLLQQIGKDGVKKLFGAE